MEQQICHPAFTLLTDATTHLLPCLCVPDLNRVCLQLILSNKNLEWDPSLLTILKLVQETRVLLVRHLCLNVSVPQHGTELHSLRQQVLSSRGNHHFCFNHPHFGICSFLDRHMHRATQLTHTTHHTVHTLQATVYSFVSGCEPKCSIQKMSLQQHGRTSQLLHVSTFARASKMENTRSIPMLSPTHGVCIKKKKKDRQNGNYTQVFSAVTVPSMSYCIR